MADDTEEASGLPAEPKAPPSVLATLAPNTPKHANVLKYLKDRIQLSENKMSVFYPRWRVNERRMQAHIDLPNYEKILKEMNKAGEPPSPVSIVIPYSYATVWTIVTYLMHTFCGRKPIFQVGTYKPETAEAASNMETMLQYNADHTRLVKHLTQFFLDGGIFGLGVQRILWKEEKKWRTAWKSSSPLGTASPGMAAQAFRTREQRTIYQGNDVRAVDPFMFFPDPRVPMNEVAKRGEFVFWRSYEGEMTLRKAQRDGLLMHIESIGTTPSNIGFEGSSNRNLLSLGEAHAGRDEAQSTLAKPYHQIDQGVVEIIPAELGLGPEQDPQKWLFSLANKTQVIQAEPFEADHDMHPVAVIEPNSFGYGFGQPGVSDFLGPIQDTMSWFINSHIHNVRAAINNSLVYDPSMIEEQDLKNPKPGKLIRLKRTASGQDVRMALQQLQVVDVTAGHVNDMQAFMRIGDALSAVNDNLRGVQEAGGRKTATEVRTSGEAGASRLAATARMISAQGMVDLAEQMCVNIQQYQTEDFYFQVLGQKASKPGTTITPQSLAGDFYFPVHDGTLPLDRVALFDVWKEILLGIMQSPVLQAQFPFPEIFEHVAKLGGAEDLANFRVKVAQPTPEEVAASAQPT